MSSDSVHLGTRWATRIVPIFILGAVCYATYAVVSVICVDYLYAEKHQSGTVVAILILYFLFFALSIATYARLMWTVKTDAGLVPLDSKAGGTTSTDKRHERSRRGDVEAGRGYNLPDQDPDSPGLEMFYSKDVFVCESDGRPKWCYECCQWKPDRAHHSSEIGRCVRKMDHFCPWVGGMVSETSFNFFTQFTSYCAAYCGVIIAAGAYCLATQVKDSFRIDGRVIAVLVLAAFFGLFTFVMAGSSIRFILLNTTNIETLKKPMSYQLAVRVPRGTQPTEKFAVVTYPLPRAPSAADGQVDPRRPGDTPSSRDRLATRTFAILKTEPGENPWNLGYSRNWREVMGRNIFEVLFPIARSPCTKHESPKSDYPMGPLLAELKARYGISDATERDHGVELGGGATTAT